jgi:[acyl-carrier-protein] S-malonyltransferase
MDKVFVNVDRYGNMSSATVPVALDEAVEQGRLKPGRHVLMVAFGAGFTWASTVCGGRPAVSRPGLAVRGHGPRAGRGVPRGPRTFEEADDVLGFALSRSLGGSGAELTATSNAQPAILTHSVAVFRVVQERLGDVSHGGGPQPGRVQRLRGGRRAVVRRWRAHGAARGELMQRSGAERPGTMAALLGLDDERRRAGVRGGSAEGGVVRAGQLQLAGPAGHQRRRGGGRAGHGTGEGGGRTRAVRLNVSGAFHSPLMRWRKPGWRRSSPRAVRAPRFPVVSNVTASR